MRVQIIIAIIATVMISSVYFTFQPQASADFVFYPVPAACPAEGRPGNIPHGFSATLSGSTL